jgi:hypothetical protein
MLWRKNESTPSAQALVELLRTARRTRAPGRAEPSAPARTRVLAA